MTAALAVLNASRSGASVASAKAAGTSFLKKRMLPSICSIAISVKMRTGEVRLARASSRKCGICFSRATSARSRSSAGAYLRFMIT